MCVCVCLQQIVDRSLESLLNVLHKPETHDHDQEHEEAPHDETGRLQGNCETVKLSQSDTMARVIERDVSIHFTVYMQCIFVALSIVCEPIVSHPRLLLHHSPSLVSLASVHPLLLVLHLVHTLTPSSPACPALVWLRRGDADKDQCGHGHQQPVRCVVRQHLLSPRLCACTSCVVELFVCILCTRASFILFVYLSFSALCCCRLSVSPVCVACLCRVSVPCVSVACLCRVSVPCVCAVCLCRVSCSTCFSSVQCFSFVLLTRRSLSPAAAEKQHDAQSAF